MQPICAFCWPLYMPDRDPRYRVQAAAVGCAFCGRPTCAGLRVEADPALVRYPEKQGATS